MGRCGRKRWLSVEDAYWKLILAGVGPIEVARRIGIARATGFRWRAERGGVAPLRMLEADRHTRYPSSIERERLAALRREGLSMREISRRLGRSLSTISRELRQNICRHDRGKYDAVLAHARSREKARRGSKRLTIDRRTYALFLMLEHFRFAGTHSVEAGKTPSKTSL